MTRLCSTGILETWYNKTRIDGVIFPNIRNPGTAYEKESAVQEQPRPYCSLSFGKAYIY